MKQYRLKIRQRACRIEGGQRNRLALLVGQGCDQVAGVGGGSISPKPKGSGKAGGRKQHLSQVSKEEEKWVQWKEGFRVVRETGREKSFPQERGGRLRMSRCLLGRAGSWVCLSAEVEKGRDEAGS